MRAGVHIQRWDGPTVLLLLVGLLPLLGLAIFGHWPDWELGAGTAIALFAVGQLASPG